MASYMVVPDLEQNEAFLRATHQPEPESEYPTQKPNAKRVAFITFSCMVVLSLMAIMFNGSPDAVNPSSGGSLRSDIPKTWVSSRGKREGVSEKVHRGVGVGFDAVSYPWTNDMLLWQRTGYHFQPQKNWMNDPNE